MKKINVFILTSLFTMGLMGEAFASDKISRSCKAKWEIENPTTGGRVAIERFSAKGYCGRTVPNRCRVRAKNAAHKCMNVHWDTRWERKKPEHCQPALSVYNYEMHDVKKRIERRACEHFKIGENGKVINVYAVTTGEKKCFARSLITKTYKIIPSMCL